jgi:hypothetical protein
MNVFRAAVYAAISHSFSLKAVSLSGINEIETLDFSPVRGGMSYAESCKNASPAEE